MEHLITIGVTLFISIWLYIGYRWGRSRMFSDLVEMWPEKREKLINEELEKRYREYEKEERKLFDGTYDLDNCGKYGWKCWIGIAIFFAALIILKYFFD